MASIKAINIFRNAFGEFFLILATLILFFIIIPFLLALFTPIYFLRFVVSMFSYFGPNLGKIISAHSALLALDDIYGNPRCTVLICSVMKGDSEDIIKFARESFLKRIVNSKAKNGELKYPEVQQYPYRWMGFLFWKWEDSFDLSQHINFYSSPKIERNSPVSETQLRQIENSLLCKPFQKNCSPWELLVVRNVEFNNSKERHSVLLSRFHHSIGDGFALQNLYLTTFAEKDNDSYDGFVSKPRVVSRTSFSQILHLFKNILVTPYQYTDCVLKSFMEKRYGILKCDNKTFKAYSLSEKIKLADLKQISRHYQVGLTTVIFAGITAAIRKSMHKKLGNVPKYVRLTCPVPVPGRSNKLRNYMSYLLVRLPVGEIDSLKRLHKIQTTLDDLKNSLVPAISYYTFPLIGALFPFLTKLILQKPITPSLSSSFPGPKHKTVIHGQDVIDLYFLTGPFESNHDSLYHTMTYCDGLKVAFMANSVFVENDAEADEVTKYIQEEYSNLKKQINIF